MDLAEAAARAERFLREHLASRPPPGADDFTVTIERVAPSDGGLDAVFGVSIPFRFGDTRAIERINGCLRALHAAHPDLRALRIEVTADTIAPGSL